MLDKASVRYGRTLLNMASVRYGRTLLNMARLDMARFSIIHVQDMARYGIYGQVWLILYLLHRD